VSVAARLRRAARRGWGGATIEVRSQASGARVSVVKQGLVEALAHGPRPWRRALHRKTGRRTRASQWWIGRGGIDSLEAAESGARPVGAALSGADHVFRAKLLSSTLVPDDNKQSAGDSGDEGSGAAPKGESVLGTVMSKSLARL